METNTNQEHVAQGDLSVYKNACDDRKDNCTEIGDIVYKSNNAISASAEEHHSAPPAAVLAKIRTMIPMMVLVFVGLSIFNSSSFLALVK